MNLDILPLESKISNMKYSVFRYPGIKVTSSMHEKLNVSFKNKNGIKIKSRVEGVDSLMLGILSKRLNGDSDFALGEFHDMEGNKVDNPAQASNEFIYSNPELIGDFDVTSFFDYSS